MIDWVAPLRIPQTKAPVWFRSVLLLEVIFGTTVELGERASYSLQRFNIESI